MMFDLNEEAMTTDVRNSENWLTIYPVYHRPPFGERVDVIKLVRGCWAERVSALARWVA